MNAPFRLFRLSPLAALLLLTACAGSENAAVADDTGAGSSNDAALDTGAGSGGDTGTDAAGSGGDAGTDGSGSGQDTTADVADTTVEPACTALAAGSWNVNGSCIGMLMTGDLTLDASGCSFTLGGWNMAMDVPAGGTVEGDTVTFTGRNWSGCTGTVASTGMRVDARCPAAGGSPACSFTMIAR